MRRNLILFLLWLGVIVLCLLFGRRVNHWFEGTPGFWAASLLVLCALATTLLALKQFRKIPADQRLLPGLSLLGAGLGLFILAWLQPLLIERTHLLLYGVLGVLAYNLAGHWSQGWARTGLAALICGLIGGLDELGQHLHPQRVGDLRDVLTNGTAAMLIIWAWHILQARQTHPG